MSQLLRIYLTVPMTSVSAERSFSAMKIIKMYLRNSMSQERLSSLAVIHTEKELAQKIDFDRVIDRFGSIKNLRLLFK